MSDEEKGRSAPRNGPEQQDTPEQQVAVDTAMWIDDQAWVQSITIPDATTSMDVTITTTPSTVLAANVANMYAYANELRIQVRP